tara:strand:- start:5311 stop:6483 length:1173 start_codon:yes stop_codon:yes gene_type:complete
MKYEFTIFGSGISAKIASSLLARNGFKVCLILDKDKNLETSNTNLVTFLSSGSLNYLSSAIAKMELFNEYPEIEKIKCQLDSLSKKKSQSIEFCDEEKNCLGKIVKNSDLEHFLDIEINQSSNIDIINSNQPDKIENKPDGVRLELHNGENIESDLFILSSTKRNIADQTKIKFIKRDLEQEALSISVKGEIKNKSYAFQKFTPDGPLALLPYSQNKASVVWSLKKDSKIFLKEKKELAQIINNHICDYVASVTIESIEKHKLQFVYAKNLFYKNTVLIGNVAHNIHPIAGQGLNLSIKDIALFVKQISKYKSLGYKLNDQMMLEEFEMKRKLDNTAYSFGTFTLNGIFSSSNKFVNYTSRKGLGIIEKGNLLKQLFVRSATGKDFFENF